ncbi:MAG: AAA family ATPase, partial [Deltaproteobacteria bacterium]|nr:AAA family ATPase [Deltaproteobacteria bacterium]
MKDILIGIQDIKTIFEEDCVYADKTNLIHNLIKKRGAYFLSRPRRFGKTLLLRTIEFLFTGSVDPDNPKGLFADLQIGNSDWDFTQKHPTLYLYMAQQSANPQLLEEALQNTLRARAKLENKGVAVEDHITFNYSDSGGMLADLIEGLARKYNARVVLLIDEYDAPVSDHIGDLDLGKANQAVLKSFYSRLKPCEDYLKFTLVTGVTRYAFMGLSAG